MAARPPRLGPLAGRAVAPRPALRVMPVLVAIVGAVAIGGVVAADLSIGLVLVAAACYASLVFVNLRLGIALMVPLLFVDAIAAFNLGGKAAVGLVIVAWLAASAGGAVQPALGRHALLLSTLVLLVLWLTLSLTWAVDVGVAAEGVWQWYVVGAVFLVVATTMVDAAAVRLAAEMFVIGALISMAIGVVEGDLRATGVEAGRLTGAAGDPNLLAAGLVPALVLALGLLPVRSAPIWRWSIVVGVGVLSLGIAASGSRGALAACVATIAFALVALPRRRVQVIIVAAGVVIVAAMWFWVSPSVWQRVTSLDGGAGRDDLWKVAWSVAGDHPVAGVGLDNFTVVEGDYTLTVGPLENVDLITTRPHQVHNVYLQMLAETGVVGFALFVTFVVGSVAAALRAARVFAASGDEANAALATAIGLAGFAMSAASFFVSNAVDRRLWVLLALGPALLTAASAARHPAGAGGPGGRRR